MRWYRKAADQGHAFAQNNIGNLYNKGQGVTQDYVEALRWYRKAADQGNAWAHYSIGLLYQDGRGVPQDKVQARAWMQKAAAKAVAAGDDVAKDWAKKWLAEN
jgi:TPR repeat protein